jgi:hypothetical protein
MALFELIARPRTGWTGLQRLGLEVKWLGAVD